VSAFGNDVDVTISAEIASWLPVKAENDPERAVKVIVDVENVLQSSID